MSLTDELKSTIDEMRSITDELRKWFDTNRIHWFGRRPEIEPMLDRIDAELAERYVKLPVDADDMPIHIGDKMVFLDFYGNKSEPFVVEGFESPDMWLVHCDEGRRRYMANPMHTRHYHSPTVEDVLLEACKAYHGLMVESMSDVAHDMQAPSEVIAEYAAKLCLKEDK